MLNDVSLAPALLVIMHEMGVVAPVILFGIRDEATSPEESAPLGK